MQALSKAAKLLPDDADTHNNLGIALQIAGRLHDAVLSYKHAIKLQPECGEAYNNLGNVQQALGQLAKATVNFRIATQLRPHNATFHTNLLFCLTHDEAAVAADVFAAHCAFGQRFASGFPAPVFSNTRDPVRRLRLGFVSADLREHVVAGFLLPVWNELDTTQVELHVYYNFANEDAISTQFRARCRNWRQVTHLSDDALAEQIRADGIDILFDLAGHTAFNRLLAFARKPAPIQITWIGYPNTTGLPAMDYVLCDRYNAPPGLYEHLYVEKFARLPSSGTFAALSDTPPLQPLPALQTGHITFGSLNRVSKLGENVLSAWCRVLRAVPNAHLLLGDAGDPLLVKQLTARFVKQGVAAERLTFSPRVSTEAYLSLHHQIDIMLDTWPYTGGTTAHYALWMGVPVLTLTGPSRSHCQAAAVLARMGLDDWIAKDADDFVARAIHWANSLPALADLRAGMRERWATAPLRQPATVARGLERAVRVMWQRWCAGLPAADFEIAADNLTVSANTLAA